MPQTINPNLGSLVTQGKLNTNADVVLATAGIAVSVAFDSATGSFTMTSDSTGVGSSVVLTTVPAATGTALGVAVGAVTAGVNSGAHRAGNLTGAVPRLYFFQVAPKRFGAPVEGT